MSLGVPQGSGRRRAAAGSGRAAVWEHTSLLLALLLARWRTDSGLETERPGPGLLHVSLSPPPRRETGAVCRVRVRVCPCGRCTVPMCVCVLRVCAYVCEGVCVHVSVWETCFPPVCACLCVRVCAHVCESVHVCVCLCGRRAVPPRVCPCVSVCVRVCRVCPCVSVCVRAFPGRGRVRLLCLLRPECACPSVCLSLAQLHACSPRGQQRRLGAASCAKGELAPRTSACRLPFRGPDRGHSAYWAPRGPQLVPRAREGVGLESSLRPHCSPTHALCCLQC